MTDHHYDIFDIIRQAPWTAGKDFTFYVVCEDGDSVNNPASTSGRRIYGPCTVKVTKWADGNIDMEFVDGVPPKRVIAGQPDHNTSPCRATFSVGKDRFYCAFPGGHADSHYSDAYGYWG